MIILCGLLVSTFAFATENEATLNSDYHLRSSAKKQSRVSTPVSLPDALTAGIYQQDIDHSGLLAGQTFSQRYWVDSEYASSPADKAPVIYHICGEGDATQGYFLNDNAIEWAKTLGAHLVYLEHRYYGQSLPFPDLSSDHMQYLTLDNVLADLAGFQQWISTQQGWQGKWISVGGSYSATLSAIYRYTHPELVVGALAASAPMYSGPNTPEGTQSDLNDASSTDPSSDTGDRQWVYQACTTFAFWQTDETTIYDPSTWLCQQLFGNNVTLADSNAYNQKYEVPFISNSASSPTNILFTYGSADIWTTIGISQQENANPDITIWTINGAGHHFDLNAPTATDSADVLAARQEFVTLAQQWLGVN